MQNFIINEVYKPENGSIKELEEEQYCSNQKHNMKDSSIDLLKNEQPDMLEKEKNNYN